MKDKAYTYSQEDAEKPWRFIDDFSPDGFEVQEYQKKEIIEPAFGWSTESGNLKHRFVYWEVPKGNGKSGLLTWLAIYGLVAAGHKKGEVYVAAGDKDQARIIFDDCFEAVNSNPVLKAACRVTRDKITHIRSGSFLKVVSAEAFTKHGYRPTMIIIDEFHVQRNRELYDTLTKGLTKRKRSICFMLTTAGYKETFAHDQHLYAKDILTGRKPNPAWHVVIHGADPKCDPMDRSVWEEVNPGWGTLVDPEGFEMMAVEAEAMPSALASFKRLYLNIWTGISEDWIPSKYWDECYDPDFDPDTLRGKKCMIGLDLSSKVDLSACAFMVKDGLRYRLFVLLWAPEDTIMERAKLENVNYMEWAKTGVIHAIPGRTNSPEVIAADIMKFLDETGMVPDKLFYDRALASEVIESLNRSGLKTHDVSQTRMILAGPTSEFERMIVGGMLDHRRNPAMSWMFGNVQVTADDHGNRMISKGKSRGRVDGIAAAINCVYGYYNKLSTSMPEGWTPLMAG